MKIVFVLIVSLGLVDASCYYNRPTNSSSPPVSPCLACKAIEKLEKYIKERVTSTGSYSYDPFGDNLWNILRQNIGNDVISQNNWNRFVKAWKGARVNRNPDLLAREVINVLSPGVLKCCGMVEINPTTGQGSLITNGGNVGVNASAGNVPSGLTICQAKRILLDYYEKRADTPQGPRLLRILSKLTRQGLLPLGAKVTYKLRLQAIRNPYVIATKVISVLRRPRVNNCCKNNTGGNAKVGVSVSNRDGGADATDRDDGVDATDSDDEVDATDRNSGANAGNGAFNKIDFSRFYLTTKKYQQAIRKVEEYIKEINNQGQSYDPSGDKFLALLTNFKVSGTFTQKQLDVFEELKKGTLKGDPLSLALTAHKYLTVSKAFVVLDEYINEVTEKGQKSFDPNGNVLLDNLKGFQDEGLIGSDDLNEYGSDGIGNTLTVATKFFDKLLFKNSAVYDVEIC